MNFRFNRKNSVLRKWILLGIAIPLFLLPFIHYHPETSHSHHELEEAHQHEGRYHSATLEAYAHLVNGHFSDRELDDHFHHSHSSEDYDDSDSGFYTLAKTSKSFKQDLVSKQPVYASSLGYSSIRIFSPTDLETLFFKTLLSRSSHSSRSPPPLYL
jgi:hypothetical protein